MKSAVLIEPHYLPSIEYFSALFSFEDIVLEGHEHFQKQTYRNRAYINTAQGKKMLTIPVINGHGKVKTKDVLIEPGNSWRNIHWRTIESAYRKAPFFDHYSDDLKKIIYQNHEYLFDLDRDLMSFCLQQVGQKKNISETMTYEKEISKNIFDCRSLILSKQPLVNREFYKPRKYQQVFGNEFVTNLSVIDLLFCEGPRIREFILQS